MRTTDLLFFSWILGHPAALDSEAEARARTVVLGSPRIYSMEVKVVVKSEYVNLKDITSWNFWFKVVYI